MTHARLIGVVIGLCAVSACTSPDVEQTEFVWTEPEWSPPSTQAALEGLILQPGDDIQAVVDANPAGSTYVFTTGEYRLQSIIPKAGDTFQGMKGAVMKGSVVLRKPAPHSESTWSTDAPIFPEYEERGRCTGDSEACALPQDLFVDGQLIRRVLSEDQMTTETWMYDESADLIVLGFDADNKVVELSLIAHAFSGKAPGVEVTGLTIEMYATPAQRGTITPAANWTVRGNEIRLNHGGGIRLASGLTATDNYIHHNGHVGMSGGGRNIVISDNEIAYNNTVGFAPLWSGGGVKAVNAKGLSVSQNLVHSNFGPGLWTDIDSENVLYEGNRVYNNTHGGIKHEISFSATIRDNHIAGNGFEHHVEFRGAGILIRESSDVEVMGNRLEGNAVEIAALHEDRESGKHGAYELRNLWVHDNEILTTGGLTGIHATAEREAVFGEWNNRFDLNTYSVSGEPNVFRYGRSHLDFDGWQRKGNDRNGTLEIVKSGTAN